jgi:hypothetical protein
MSEYLTCNEANSMPFAFNTSAPAWKSTILKEIQRSDKTPTEEFYNSTKNLCYRLIKMLEERGNSSEGRTLKDIYNYMHGIWATILTFNMLTKYASRKLRLF